MKIRQTIAASAIALANLGVSAAFLGTASVAQASPITYDLSGASFVDPFTDTTAQLSGQFTFDQATGFESNVADLAPESALDFEVESVP
jgi:hypothetical protein